MHTILTQGCSWQPESLSVVCTCKVDSKYWNSIQFNSKFISFSTEGIQDIMLT